MGQWKKRPLTAKRIPKLWRKIVADNGGKEPSNSFKNFLHVMFHEQVKNLILINKNFAIQCL